MNILDEDESNFVYYDYNSHDNYDSMAIRRCAADLGCAVTKILYIKCHASCDSCIGSKYNLQNGCPACSSDICDILVQSDTIVRSLYRCTACGLIIADCGHGDISMIGLTADIVKAEDDII